MHKGIALLFVSQLALVGCESSPKGSSTPPKEVVKTAPKQGAPATAPVADGLIDVESAPLRVARLVVNERLSIMNPSEYCLDDGKLYLGAKYRLGRVNVFGVDKELDAIAQRGLVAVVGETKTGLDAKLQESGACPENYEPIHVQMRSDWVAPEKGPNTTRATLAALPYQEGQRVIAVDMAEFPESNDDLVRVRIRNPFSLPLAGLKFVAHYEGGRGKPMPTMVEKVLALEPGASVEIEVPRRLADPGPRSKAGSGLHSFLLEGRLGQAELDIEIFVPH